MCKFYSIDICLPVGLCFQMVLFTLDLSFKVTVVLTCAADIPGTYIVAASTVRDTLTAYVAV